MTPWEAVRAIEGAEVLAGGRVVLLPGDCRRRLAELPDSVAHACITDPPYHLVAMVERFGRAGAAAPRSDGATGIYARLARGFMGQTWDGGRVAHEPDTWRAVLRTVKPGAHVGAFGAARTYHRLACAIEDAGLTIADSVLSIADGDRLWEDFLASLSAGQRDALGRCLDSAAGAPALAWIFATAAALRSKNIGRQLLEQDPESEWEGWGTYLKTAFEPMVLARAPLSESSVAENVRRHGTGAINIDAARPESGRWPANVVHDASPAATAGFPDSAGALLPVRGDEPSRSFSRKGTSFRRRVPGPFYGDTGSASRFFYGGRAKRSDRAGSRHPTVKPVALMSWLVRLLCPADGIVLDPFGGSGTTAAAAVAEGRFCIIVESEPEYCTDIRRRLAGEPVTTATPRADPPAPQLTLFGLQATSA